MSVQTSLYTDRSLIFSGQSSSSLSSTIDSFVTQENENESKLTALDDIQEGFRQIRVELLKPENNVLLEELLDNLVKNRLEYIDLKVINSAHPRLARSLSKVAQKYREVFNANRPETYLLKQIVDDVNYTRLMGKEKSMLVGKSMELLKGSHEHILKMKGKQLIILLGNTGSGKSTAVNYLLGLKLIKMINQVGDNVYCSLVKNEESSQPKIGQSLGESETLYARGYELPQTKFFSSSTLIVDCPGFEDTRGGDYEVCTNISIDQVVSQAQKINALVLTIPIHAFLIDKGNHIIDLIEKFKGRFPETFDLENPRASANIYLLITKSSQIPIGTVEAIEDGRRVAEFYKEAQSRVSLLLEKKGDETKLDEFGIESSSRRGKIWQFITQMYSNGQVDLIDIEDEYARKKLLIKYSSDKDITNLYYPSLNSPEMVIKFERNLEVYSWISAFKEYLEKLPLQFKEITDATKNKEENLRQLNLLKRKKIREAQKVDFSDFQRILITLIKMFVIIIVLTRINMKVWNTGRSIIFEHKSLEEAQKRKRNFAILILENMGNLKLMRDFASLVLPQNGIGINSLSISSLSSTCSKFIEIYDSSINIIEQECKKDLML